MDRPQQQPLLIPTADTCAFAAAAAATATTAASAEASPSFLFRLMIFFCLSLFSLWANYEAGKGFEITVLNSPAPAAPLARRFDLLFVSNGRAARLVLAASDRAQRVLYPDDSFPRKPVGRITLSLADSQGAVNGTVAVGPGRRPGEFVIRVSPAVMEAADAHAAVAAAVRRAVARVWLWDARGGAPDALVGAMVEFLAAPSRHAGAATIAKASCWDSEEAEACVARMNRAMQEEWSEQALDAACGAASVATCVRSSYLVSSEQHNVINAPAQAAKNLRNQTHSEA